MRHRIRIDHRKSQFVQHSRDRALSARNAPGQAEPQHRRVHRAPVAEFTACVALESDPELAPRPPRLNRAAFTVLLISIVIVIGPTPPGTGVSAPATFIS